jgi:hypothetical protein
MESCKYCKLVGLRDLYDNDDKDPSNEQGLKLPTKRPIENNENEDPQTSDPLDMENMLTEIKHVSLFFSTK